jgi:hypothetical protein
MKPSDASEVFIACEECIARYIHARRARVEEFVTRYFSARESLRFHRRWLLHDFLFYPVNTFWMLPYLFLKKAAETLDRLGVGGVRRAFLHVPPGLKTRYQREIEARIETELLEWPRAMLEELHADPRLAPHIRSGTLSPAGLFPSAPVKTLLKEHTAARIATTDLTGSAGMMVVGGLLFHDRSVDLAEAGTRLARYHAQDRSASHFLLGREAGRAWYTLFPPEPSRLDMAIGIGLITVLVVSVCLAINLVMDPLRKAFGLQQKALLSFIDRLEEQLHLQAGRAAREILAAAPAREAMKPALSPSEAG